MEIEIDREGLKKYKQKSGSNLLLVISFLLALLFGFTGFVNHFTRNSLNETFLEAAAFGLLVFVIAFPLLVGLTCSITYFTYWKYAAVYAAEFEVKIEGSYLRIIEKSKSFCDRKIHFNQLMDYAVYQSAEMKKCDIFSIRIGTNQTLGPSGHSNITLLGIKNPEQVRDELTKIDFLREDAKDI